MCGMILYHNDLYSLSCVFFYPWAFAKGYKKNPQNSLNTNRIPLQIMKDSFYHIFL